MTIEMANALYRYFEALYQLNKNLLVLCGTDIRKSNFDYEYYIDEVVMIIPRLVPYGFNKKTKAYELLKDDGLLVFSGDVTFLYEDYNGILLKHDLLLSKIKMIRNKLEHEMHGAQIDLSCNGSEMLFLFKYKINAKTYSINSKEIIAFVKDLNVLFSKLQKCLEKSTFASEYTMHPCFYNLTRYDFSDFNKIFDSDLLRIIGKAFLPF